MRIEGGGIKPRLPVLRGKKNGARKSQGARGKEGGNDHQKGAKNAFEGEMEFLEGGSGMASVGGEGLIQKYLQKKDTQKFLPGKNFSGRLFSNVLTFLGNTRASEGHLKNCNSSGNHIWGVREVLDGRKSLEAFGK